MIDYRVYILDCLGIHIEDYAAIKAANDEDAINVVSMRRDRQPSELWHYGRLVRKFPTQRAVTR